MFYFVCSLGLIACLDEAKTICQTKKDNKDRPYIFDALSREDEKGKIFHIHCSQPGDIKFINLDIKK